jgi:hypothetical protein
MARTGDAVYAGTKAGLARPETGGAKMFARPAIKAAVVARAEEILRDELLPLALATHKRLLTDTNVPAGAQLGAAKLVYDRTLGVEDSKAAKEPSEMSYDELQASIEDLRRAQQAIESQAIDVTPEPADSTMFD